MDRDTREILLIEDNPGDIRHVEEILKDVKNFSYEIYEADRLSKGLTRLNENDIDIVLLDLNLPDSSGYETFQTMHNRFPEVPVILLTGYGENHTWQYVPSPHRHS